MKPPCRRRKPTAPLGDQRGVTYLMALVAIVLVGVSLMVVGKQWSVEVRRDREAELLFRGNRIKAAIKAYASDYDVMKGGRTTRYPTKLDQLTKPDRRYLPVVYKDPITGGDFELILVNAEIYGVKSPGKERPLNQTQFKGVTAYNQALFKADDPAQ